MKLNIVLISLNLLILCSFSSDRFLQQTVYNQQEISQNSIGNGCGSNCAQCQDELICTSCDDGYVFLNLGCTNANGFHDKHFGVKSKKSNKYCEDNYGDNTLRCRGKELQNGEAFHIKKAQDGYITFNTWQGRCIPNSSKILKCTKGLDYDGDEARFRMFKNSDNQYSFKNKVSGQYWSLKEKRKHKGDGTTNTKHQYWYIQVNKNSIDGDKEKFYLIDFNN